METFGTTNGEPSVDITITDCGIFTPLETPGAGYWLDQPDEQAYSGVSPVFIVHPRVAVVTPTMAVAERLGKAMNAHAAITAVCIGKCDDVSTRIDDLLCSFSIDVVLVAPACNHICTSIKLPPSWDGIPVDHVVLQAKPVNALATVWTCSWLTKLRHYPLDGLNT